MAERKKAAAVTSPETEPERDHETSPDEIEVTARTLSFAHRAGYAEGYTDATRSILMTLSALGFCAVMIYRLYSEPK